MESNRASSLISSVLEGMAPADAIRQLAEKDEKEGALDKAKKYVQSGEWKKGAAKTAGALAGAYMLGKGSYKAGKLAGSIGRKKAFLKGFGMGTAAGSIGTAGASLLHKGAQQAGREQALSRYAHGHAQVPSFSFSQIQGQGHHGGHPGGMPHYGMPGGQRNPYQLRAHAEEDPNNLVEEIKSAVLLRKAIRETSQSRG